MFNTISKETDIQKERDLIYFLVENYCDNRIIPFFISKIKSEKVGLVESSYIYACNEYSVKESSQYIEVFIDLIIHSNYECAWYCISLIDDIRAYFNEINYDVLLKCYNKLVNAFLTDTENDNIEFIKDAIFFLENDVIKPNKRYVP